MLIQRIDCNQSEVKLKKNRQFDKIQRPFQKQTHELFEIFNNLFKKQIAEQHEVYEHLLFEKDGVINKLQSEPKQGKIV